jgi:hypothetical protein
MLNDTYVQLYNPFEHLAVDEVIVLFEGRVIFKQYIPKKHKRFGIKTYKLCDMTVYTYNTSVYLGKNRQNATQTMTATHTKVKSITSMVEEVGHKIYMGNFFSSLDLMTCTQELSTVVEISEKIVKKC